MGQLHPRIQGPAGHALEPGSRRGARAHDPGRRALRAGAVRRRSDCRASWCSGAASIGRWCFGIAAIISGGYGGVAMVARRKLGLDVGLNHLRDVLGLLAAGMAGAAIVALLLSLLLLADDQLDLPDVLVTVGPLLVGDAIGIAVMTPLDPAPRAAPLTVGAAARFAARARARALRPGGRRCALDHRGRAAGHRLQVLLPAFRSGRAHRRAARPRRRLHGPRDHPAWPRRPACTATATTPTPSPSSRP